MTHAAPTIALLLTVLAAGCAAGSEFRRASGLRDHLEAATTEATLDDVRAAAERLPPADYGLDAPFCEACVEEVACVDDSCGIWIRSLYQQSVLLARRQDGRTSVRLHRGGDLLGSEALLAFWKVLDPEVAKTAALAPTRTSWRQRFGPSFQLSLHGATGWGVGGGLRLGAWHWLGPSVASAYTLDLDSGPRDGPHGTPVATHTFALTARLGFARWSRWSDAHWNVPGATVYLHASPVLARVPQGASFGWRGGLGVSTGVLPAGVAPFSLFIEGYAERLGVDREPVFGVTLAVGW